jgi:hypothetical protein
VHRISRPISREELQSLLDRFSIREAGAHLGLVNESAILYWMRKLGVKSPRAVGRPRKAGSGAPLNRNKEKQRLQAQKFRASHPGYAKRYFVDPMPGVK